jgi:hypothetical protein
MTSNWEPSTNFLNLPIGLRRSIYGYAGESLVIGRALLCGYNLFFKAWRDSKYDAVLDFEGSLFRIEIKQTFRGEKLTLTSGGRSGQQINRDVASREELVSSDDCEVLIGVHTLTGNSWLLPIDVISIFGKKSVTTEYIKEYFEAWAIFPVAKKYLGKYFDKFSLRNAPIEDLHEIANLMGITVKDDFSYDLGPRMHLTFDNEQERYIIAIWTAICRLSKPSDF